MKTTITTRTIGRVALLLTLSAAVLLSGCGSTPAQSPDQPAATEEPTATEDATPVALVARATAEVAVYDDPSDSEPASTLPATTPFGSTTVLLVNEVGAGAQDGWLEVQLPVRPNEATGWISSDDVDLQEVEFEVLVDLDSAELTVTENGVPVLVTTTGMGATEYPTPTGRFYITDKLETPNPDGAYGPYALGLSAYSDVLDQFMGGEGQIGIHGTNEPGTIGKASSHGCLRIDNDLIVELAQMLPLGTPVTIT